MCKIKIALYVEGQTEQILLNHFIQIWWNYSEIHIQNLKLLSVGTVRCKVPNFPSTNIVDPNFLIIDIEGVGSLPSIIASRANRQHDMGYEIIALRDLYAQDYEILHAKMIRDDFKIKITEHFKVALGKLGCKNPEKIDLFFAVMEVEAWLLAFSLPLARWSQTTPNIIKNRLNKYIHLEQIKRPAKVIEQLRRIRDDKDPKSFDSLMSLIKPITREEIQDVYHSERIPHFNLLWDRLTSAYDKK